MFYSVSSSESGVDFENVLDETDDFNIIEYLYFYNGAGIAIGDINNDGLPDLYFSSNQHSNKLYLNKGGFKFEDITESAGVKGAGNWKTGVTMADVNGDGLLDIFSCGVGQYKNFTGKNQLYLNNGNLTFTESSAETGLSFQGFSTQASFFDYDNDGDLDMYLVNHAVHTRRSYGSSILRYDSDPLAGDKLYRNNLIPDGKLEFKEVTLLSGIFNSQIAYGLAVGVSDLNRDGYSDIYVSNDFGENDYLYINQHDGTFKQDLDESIPHSSRFSMGSDIADINNDGWEDIITLDMLPKDEAVIKTTAGEDTYDIYDFKLKYGYHYQFSRNALQLNRGLDMQGKLMFSDIAPLAGVEATDWSWAPLLADFDNDGYRDLFVANGIKGRPNDLDYINYISSDSAQRFFSNQQLISKMPSGKVSNVFYKNDGDLIFSDSTTSWVGNDPSLSNGASYADLDDDGDLDLVVNNINAQAFLYRNDLHHVGTNFVKFALDGSDKNKFGIGTAVTIFAGKETIIQEQVPTRGWLSSVDYTMHVGLGKLHHIDSVHVRWPGKQIQVLRDIKINALNKISQGALVASANATKPPVPTSNTLMTSSETISFEHKEDEFIAFNSERLIPRMLTTEGPGLATGDINGDKLDDIFICGGAGQAGAVLVQQADGKFVQTLQREIDKDSVSEDVDARFFDADGNGTLDLIVVSGGQAFPDNHEQLIPRLYLNTGKGVFRSHAFPAIGVNASCVRPGDVDGDGDLDLLIGGQVISGQYGIDATTYLLFNDGHGNFAEDSDSELTQSLRLHLNGMINDVAWADLNGDKKQDLIVAGDWMPITILLQTDSRKFVNNTMSMGFDKTNGWWQTLAVHDMDGDGDFDIVGGNFGTNSRLRPTIDEPVSMFVGDVDGNGSLDHLLQYYNAGKAYPFVSRDQLVKQVPSLKRKFLKYDNFRDVTITNILPQDQLDKFKRLDVFTFASAYFENLGDGKFRSIDLPLESQFFPIYAICIDDVNADGHPDILAAGNLDAISPDIGRADAGYGIVLLGDNGTFKALSPQASGFIVKGQARDIKRIKNRKGESIYIVSKNGSKPELFKLKMVR